MAKYKVFYKGKHFQTIELKRNQLEAQNKALQKGLPGAYMEEIKDKTKKDKKEVILKEDKE
jgi:hypothetical protein